MNTEQETCDCGTFNLYSSLAYIDTCGFLHTSSKCPGEKWVATDRPQQKERTATLVFSAQELEVLSFILGESWAPDERSALEDRIVEQIDDALHRARRPISRRSGK